MTKITLPSGAALAVQLGSFDDAVIALQAIGRELLKVDIDIEATSLPDLMKAVGEMDFNVLKNTLLVVVVSKDVRSAVDKLLSTCTYNDLKIDKQTFQPAEGRGDYLLAAWEVIKQNVGPFFAPLLAKFAASDAASSGDPTSGST